MGCSLFKSNPLEFVYFFLLDIEILLLIIFKFNKRRIMCEVLDADIIK